MAAHGTERVARLVVQIVGHLDPCSVNLHEIERIAFAFSAPAVPGGRRTRLHEDDASVARPFKEEIEGVADERTVQMAAQDDIDSHFDERFHRLLAAEHVPISQPVWGSDEVMVGHQDASSFSRSAGQGDSGELDLRWIDLATNERPVRSRRVESDDRGTLELQHLVDVRSDVPPVLAQRIKDSLPEPIEWHIVIAGYRESRKARELVHEIPGFSKLLRLRALGQVAADNDGIGSEGWCNALKRVSDGGQIGRTEMKVRYVKQCEHGVRIYGTVIEG